MYKEATAKVKLDKVGPKFAITKEVEQGDLLSLNLLNRVTEETFRELGWEEKRIRID